MVESWISQARLGCMVYDVSERMESESECGISGHRLEELEEVRRCSRSMELSGASERSSSESERGAFDRVFEVAGEAVTRSWACVLGITEDCELCRIRGRPCGAHFRSQHRRRRFRASPPTLAIIRRVKAQEVKVRHQETSSTSCRSCDTLLR